MPGHKIHHTSSVLCSSARAFFVEALGQGILSSEDNRLLATFGNSPVSAVYAATGKGEIVGIIAYTVLELDESATISLIYVEETSRKLGIFTMLFEELKGYLMRYGVRNVYLDVPGENQVLADLIEKLEGHIATYRYVIELGGEGRDGELLGQSY